MMVIPSVMNYLFAKFQILAGHHLQGSITSASKNQHLVLKDITSIETQNGK